MFNRGFGRGGRRAVKKSAGFGAKRANDHHQIKQQIIKLTSDLCDDKIEAEYFDDDTEFSKEISSSTCGSISEFNAKHQIKLSLILRLQELLSQLSQSSPPVDTIPPTTKEKALNETVAAGLVQNFELIGKLCMDDPAIYRDILKTLLHSLGNLKAHDLANEPKAPLDTLEKLLTELLDTSEEDGSQQEVLAILLSLVLSRANSARIFSMLCTLLSLCAKRQDKSASQPTMSVPKLLKSLCSELQATPLGPLDLELEYKDNGFTIPEWSKTDNASATTDGAYLYVHDSCGIRKIGSGFLGSEKGKVYCTSTLLAEHKAPVCLTATSDYLYINTDLGDDTVFIVLNKADLSEAGRVTRNGEGTLPSADHFNDPAFVSNKSSVVAVGNQIGLFCADDQQLHLKLYDPSRRFRHTNILAVAGPPRNVPGEVTGCFGAGNNGSGELGLVHNNGNVHKASHVKFFGQEGDDAPGRVISVTAGNAFSLFLTDRGKVFACGNNGHNRLGIDPAQVPNGWVSTPQEVKELSDKRIVSIGAGVCANSALFISADGSVYGSGNNNSSQLACSPGISVKPRLCEQLSGLHIVQACVDNRVSGFVTQSGELYVCGIDGNGALGLGQSVTTTSKPTKVTSIPEKVTKVVCGSTHTVALTASGCIYTTGQNGSGQLGLGTTSPSFEFTKVSAAEHFFIDVDIGYQHTAAVTRAGKAVVFGGSANGALGTGNNGQCRAPTLVPDLESEFVTHVACGAYFTIWVTRSNEVYACGNSVQGQLMIPPCGNVMSPKKVPGFGKQQVCCVSAGQAHTLIVTEDREQGLAAEHYQSPVVQAGATVGMFIPVEKATTLPGYKPDDADSKVSHVCRVFGLTRQSLVFRQDIPCTLSPAHLLLYSANTRSYFTVNAHTGEVATYLNVTKSDEFAERGLSQMLSFPTDTATLAAHPTLCLPGVGRSTVVGSVLLNLLAALDRIANNAVEFDPKDVNPPKVSFNVRSQLVLSPTPDNFIELLHLLEKSWSLQKVNRELATAGGPHTPPNLYGVALLPILRILRANLAALPRKLSDTEGSHMTVLRRPGTAPLDYWCAYMTKAAVKRFKFTPGAALTIAKVPQPYQYGARTKAKTHTTVLKCVVMDEEAPDEKLTEDDAMRIHVHPDMCELLALSDGESIVVSTTPAVSAFKIGFMMLPDEDEDGPEPDVDDLLNDYVIPYLGFDKPKAKKAQQKAKRKKQEAEAKQAERKHENADETSSDSESDYDSDEDVEEDQPDRSNLMESDHGLSTVYCSFKETGTSYVKQDFWQCLTCNSGSNVGCCRVCVRTCHKGHNVVLTHYDTSYCDCGSGDLGKPCTAMVDRVDTAKETEAVPICFNHVVRLTSKSDPSQSVRVRIVQQQGAWGSVNPDQTHAVAMPSLLSNLIGVPYSKALDQDLSLDPKWELQSILLSVGRLLETIVRESGTHEAQTSSVIVSHAMQCYKLGYRILYPSWDNKRDHLLRLLNGSNAELRADPLLNAVLSILAQEPDASKLFFPKHFDTEPLSSDEDSNTSNSQFDFKRCMDEVAKQLGGLGDIDHFTEQFEEFWFAMDANGDGRVTVKEFLAYFHEEAASHGPGYETEMMDFWHQYSKKQGGKREYLDFWDMVDFVFKRDGSPVQITRPAWAVNTALEANPRTANKENELKSMTEHTLMEGPAAECLTALIKYSECETEAFLQTVVDNPEQMPVARHSEPLQLVLWLINDVMKRAKLAEADSKDHTTGLRVFSPLRILFALMFQKAHDVLDRILTCHKLLTDSDDSKYPSDCLIPALQTALSQSYTVHTLVPFLASHLTTYLVTPRQEVEDIAYQIMDLLKKIHTINTLCGQTDDTQESYLSTVVESPHPYPPAQTQRYEISFPDDVSLLVLEFDPRSCTVQAEDFIRLSTEKGPIYSRYSGAPGSKGEWPPAALLVPGSKLTFEFCTASDYNEKKRMDRRWGFQCLVKAYRPGQNIPLAWLDKLEKQLGYVAGVCAASLVTSTASDFEKENASLFTEVPFKNGLGIHYLKRNTKHSLKFDAVSPEDKFLEAIIDKQDTTDEKTDEKKESNDEVLSPARCLINWMRHSTGGVEPMYTEATPNPADNGEFTTLSGIGNTFTVTARNEFKELHNTGGDELTVKLSVGSHSVFGGDFDFSDTVEITEVDNKCRPFCQALAVVDEDKGSIYIIGGYGGNYREEGIMTRYDIADGTYNDGLAALPHPSRGCTGGLLPDGRIFVTGNYPTDNNYIYDTSANEWTTIDVRTAVGWEAAAVVDADGLVHITGGMNNRDGYVIYDSATNSFKNGPSLPGCFMTHGAAMDHRGRLYVFGGCDTQRRNRNHDCMYYLDEGSEAWVQGPKLPGPLVQFGWCQNRNQIVVVGGSTQFPNDSEPTFDHIWTFDFESEEWSVSPCKLPHTMRAPAVCIVDDTIHIFGGSSKGQKKTWHITITSDIGSAAPSETVDKSLSKITPYLEPEITDNNDGTYTVAYSLLRPGKYYAEVLLNGHPIQNSPLLLEARPVMSDCIVGYEPCHFRDQADVEFNVAYRLRELWKDKKYALKGFRAALVQVKSLESKDAEATEDESKAADKLSPIKEEPVPQVKDDPNALWACPMCTFENQPNIDTCAMCHTAKPDANPEVAAGPEPEPEPETPRKTRPLYEGSREFKLLDNLAKAKSIEDGDLVVITNKPKTLFLAGVVRVVPKPNIADYLDNPHDLILPDEAHEWLSLGATDDTTAAFLFHAAKDPFPTASEIVIEPYEPLAEFPADYKPPSVDPALAEEAAKIVSETKECPFQVDSCVKTADGTRFVVTSITGSDGLPAMYGVNTPDTKVVAIAQPEFVKPLEVASFTEQVLFKLDPALSEEKVDGKPQEVITEPQVKREWPDWMANLRMIHPGQPPLLYAIAYRDNNRNPEEALNWLLDNGAAFMNGHKDMFEKELSSLNAKWSCTGCTLENDGDVKCSACGTPRELDVPDYFDDNHKFWDEPPIANGQNPNNNVFAQPGQNRGFGQARGFGLGRGAFGQGFGQKAAAPKPVAVVEEKEEEFVFGLTVFRGVVKPFPKTIPMQPIKGSTRILPAPPQKSPSANNDSAQAVIRMVFACLLKHHKLTHEAISCANYIYERVSVNKNCSTRSIQSPMLRGLSTVWNAATSIRDFLTQEYDKRVEEKKNKSPDVPQQGLNGPPPPQGLFGNNMNQGFNQGFGFGNNAFGGPPVAKVVKAKKAVKKKEPEEEKDEDVFQQIAEDIYKRVVLLLQLSQEPPEHVKRSLAAGIPVMNRRFQLNLARPAPLRRSNSNRKGRRNSFSNRSSGHTEVKHDDDDELSTRPPLLTRAVTTPSQGLEPPRKQDSAPRLSRSITQGAVEDTLKVKNISKTPPNVNSHVTTLSILKFLESYTPAASVRDTLITRRNRARERAGGFVLMGELIDASVSNDLKHDLIWILSSAIKRFSFSLPKEDDGNEMDQSALLGVTPGNKLVHYLDGLHGCGLASKKLVTDAFRDLYTTIARLFKPSMDAHLDDMVLTLLDAWCLDFHSQDQNFLHDSQIFPVVRRIMAPMETKDPEQKEANSKPVTLLSDRDVTNTIEQLTSSSAAHRLPSLLDGTTETYWQSGVNENVNEWNRKKQTHFIRFEIKPDPEAKPDEKAGDGDEKAETVYCPIAKISWCLDIARDADQVPKDVEVHIGNDAEALESVFKVQVPPESGWYHFPASDWAGTKFKPDADGCVRVKYVHFVINSCHGQGWEARIRQVKAYVPYATKNAVMQTPKDVKSRLQTKALHVFRGLVSKCFFSTLSITQAKPALAEEAKQEVEESEIVALDESELKEAEVKDGDATDEDVEASDELKVPVVDDPKPALSRNTSELQEEVVGLLFRDKDDVKVEGDDGELNDLQRLVVELIFAEIQRQVVTLQSVGSTLALVTPPSLGTGYEDAEERAEGEVSDTYCYELVSMVASLSVSRTGQQFISTPGFVNTLLSLLLYATPRIQRALLRILRRVLPRLNPDMMELTLPAIASGPKDANKPVQFFLYSVGSSLQGLVKGSVDGKKVAKDVTMQGWPQRFELSEAKTMVDLLRKLYAASKWKPLVQDAVRTALGGIPAFTAEALCESPPWEFWAAVSSLCFIAGDIQFANLASEFSVDGVSLDSHDAACRAKVLNEEGAARIIVFGDLSQAKAMAEFRNPLPAGTSCRFCDAPLTEKNTAPDAPCDSLACVCNSEYCIEARDTSCQKVHECGHYCCGVKDEETCLPCLNPECAARNGTKQDADSLCSVCYTDNLSGMPTIELKCGHFFHYDCVKRQLEAKWNGARITFGFAACSLCKQDVSHPSVKELADPIYALRDDVEQKALMRLKYESLENHPDIITPGARYYKDPTGFAMHKFAYYQCFKCQKPYYGGDYECVAANEMADFDPSELLCGACSPILSQDCPKHGKDFLEFKCRFCCTVAIWFCFGTTHFCEPCHNNNGTLCGKPIKDLTQCPCKPKGNNGLPEKLEGECPLGIDHPPSGEEFALGCGLCRNIKDF